MLKYLFLLTVYQRPEGGGGGGGFLPLPLLSEGRGEPPMLGGRASSSAPTTSYISRRLQSCQSQTPYTYPYGVWRQLNGRRV